jgi:hypothetical protein
VVLSPLLSGMTLSLFFLFLCEGITYEEAMALVYKKDFDRLRQRDQLRSEMCGGRVFQGLHEGSIKFSATYKFEKYISGLSGNFLSFLLDLVKADNCNLGV